MRSTIKVLVVDDSALIRQMLTRALAMDPRVEIVGTAKTGVEAIERCTELSPDVITLDIEMPELSGLEALPHIRKHSDARVVMLSSLDDPDTTYRALSLGAVDFIPKPSAGVATSLSDLTELLLKTIKTAYRITPAAALAAAQSNLPERVEGARSTSKAGTLAACVGIAASTGGPPALERVFSGLTSSMPAAYLIVQHLPQGFSASFAKRLSSASEIAVREASEGDRIEPGTAYLAPHGVHTTVTDVGGEKCIKLVEGAPVHGVRPAADVMLGSVAREFGGRSVAVVLTGMGGDGARGAVEVKDVGGDVIVQDERTSVVWGMPGTAIRLGATNRAVGVGLVAAEIRRAVRARSEQGNF